jgi:hypothetical protein
MFVQCLMDRQTQKAVFGIVTDRGGCWKVYPTQRKAENALQKLMLNPALFELADYYGNGCTGSVLMSYATGRYQVVKAG